MSEFEGWRSGDPGDDDPFDIISTKNAPIERLKRWRQSALVINASRRFRYTLDLKREEEKKQRRRKIKVHTQVLRAALLYQQARERVNVSGTQRLSPTSSGDYVIGQEQLASITKGHDFSALQQCGGVSGLASMLKTNLAKGIHGDDADLAKRRNTFGSNTYPQKKKWSFWSLFWEAWKDLTLIVLMIAAVAILVLDIHSKGIKEWYNGGSIAFAVIFVVAVRATSDYRQSLHFQNINEEKRNIHVEVVRGGRRVEVSILDIVVGDVVPLKVGDQVPADGILISGHSLAIDESSMTGESSNHIHKDLKAPFLTSGGKVADGYGTMLVTGVGRYTDWGLLMASISEDTVEETPLQVRLNGVTTSIGTVGLFVASAVLVVLLTRFFTGNTKNPDGTDQLTFGKTRVDVAIDEAIKIATIAVSIVVLAVPEGLPLAFTLILAHSMRKMMADKALVRRLSACEAMGAATTICSNKTGTLTMNQMTVFEAYAGGKKIYPVDNRSLLPPMVTSLLIEGIALNTTGSVYITESGGDVEVSGSSTENAILHWGVKIGMNFDAVRSGSSVIHAFPFNSEKKKGGVALQLPDSEVHIHWKGAAEMVLESCMGYLDANDQLVPLNEEKLKLHKEAIEDMAARSLRCLAIAFRSYGRGNIPTDKEELTHWALPETDLVLLAIVGLEDSCRPGVKDAVQLCTNAGIKVRMITGDNPLTARAIALECGILGSNGDAAEPNLIEGRTFRELSEVQRLEIAEKISVMARSSPNDKLLLVQALKKRGHVVAVTGGGTNDAPALSEADIGLAMGIQGTQVGKESSDIVILDDNFASIVKVVRWGRSIYADMQKFIQFQFTVTITTIIVDVVCAEFSSDVPLNAVQILWVNLVMDTLGALALATEPPTDNPMHRPPVGRRETLITNIMLRNILIQVLYQVTVLLVLNFGGGSILNLEHDSREHADKVLNALIQNIIVLCQIVNEFNARKPDEINVFKGLTGNHLFMKIVGLTLVLHVIIMEFLAKFTSSVRLNWRLWLVSFAISFISLPLASIGKLIPVPETPFSEFFTRRFLRPIHQMYCF